MESPIYHLEAVVKAKNEDLEDFTGPLDLILHLLSKNKMEIKDIQLSLILQQYFLWMEKRKELDLEVASEFVTMASHLVDIKTRMLLSIHDTEATSEMEELIATLEAHRNNETYTRIKKVIGQFQVRFGHGQNLLVKGPEVFEMTEQIIYEHKPGDLWRAMHTIFSRAEGKKPVEMGAFHGIVGREPYPVAQKATELMNYLVYQGSSDLGTLLSRCRSRSEVVATFIALLDLCKNNKLVISEKDGWQVECVEDGQAYVPDLEEQEGELDES